MTPSRPRDDDAGTFNSRRGHTSQLSISDPSHHVTEAIGTLYGDEDDSGSESGGRPLSFIDGSSYHEQIHRPSQRPDCGSRRSLVRSVSDEPQISHESCEDHVAPPKKSHSLHVASPNHRSSRQFETSSSPGSPALSLRDVQADASGSQFHLTNIDNPKDIAQELSNLQALRRMSMDVGNSIDPDMPPMGLSAMPVVAPTGGDDENDPSRLLWVPARVHPELAPGEFKSFLENRVQSLRRRSGESFLSPDGDPTRSGSDSLRRRKSMLSRQIDTSGGQGAVGYVDGAERLERQRSGGGRLNPELSLDDLVKDPTRAVKKFAQESQSGSIGEGGSPEDMPILPMAPGTGLRRSTRTTYRKGSSVRSRDRVPFSKRMAQRQQDVEERDTPPTPPNAEAVEAHTPDKTQSGPLIDEYSRSTLSTKRQHSFGQVAPSSSTGPESSPSDERVASFPSPVQEQLNIRVKPQASISTPPDSGSPADRPGREDTQLPRKFPQRSSSQKTGSSHQDSPPQTPDIVVEHSSGRQPSRHPAPSPGNYPIHETNSQTQYLSKSSSSPQQAYVDNSGSSSSLLSGDASRTDNLAVIPTFSQTDKKSEKKSRKDKDDDSSSTSSKSGGAWKWLKGVTDDKDKRKEESRRAKAKALAEKTSDNARLDVIQNSIENTTVKGRESVVLERDNIDSKGLEERKKEGHHRKSDAKKDKDGSIFSSIFGGSKRREEKEKSTKKTQHLQVPEEPVYKPLQPDVDYNWTRFPLLEERAIYRMAHIKLANPRRPLLSQVLLSNFMYSYLAIVQAMHPQMNVPTSPQQKRLEEEARRKQQEQEYTSRRQMDNDDAENSLEQYNFDYHRAAVQYAESGPENQVDYVDEAQIYEDDHGNDNQEGYDYDNREDYGQSLKDYYQYQNNDSDRRHGGDSMW